MACSSTQPGTTTNKSILKPVMTLEGHEPYILTFPDGSRRERAGVSCISYLPDSKQMISGSGDKTIRRWDLREGKEIEEARELKVCEVETGIVRTFHDEDCVWSIDISADGTLLAGGTIGSTARIWSLDTGKLVAGPFEFEFRGDYAGPPVLRFSENSKKLAVSSYLGRCLLQVWDVQAQKLDVIRRNSNVYHGIRVPVFWTTKDKSIVAAFTFTEDRCSTIYEFDASTLETVGAPFKGHTYDVRGLALSSDSVLLVSASYDHIKLWAFKSRQLLASFDAPIHMYLILSPDSHQLAYTRWVDNKIYICDIPVNILASVGLEPQPSTIACPTDLLNSDATRRTVRRRPVTLPVISPIPRPPRPLTTRDPLTFLRFLRTFLSSSHTDAVRPICTDEPRNPLDFPATAPLPRHINSFENSQPTLAPSTIQSSATNASTTFKSRLHRLSTWWPVQADDALPPIVDVPLAPGKLRHAAAGAPGPDDDLIRDEGYSPPPSPNPDSRRAPTAGQTKANTGEHGSGRLCFCL